MPKKHAVALNWVVNEMEERYQLLAKVGARNIEAYNEKQEKIPYIVVIIDELADLMMVSRDQIENAITRLAQLSRAVGIHLILSYAEAFGRCDYRSDQGKFSCAHIF